MHNYHLTIYLSEELWIKPVYEDQIIGSVEASDRWKYYMLMRAL